MKCNICPRNCAVDRSKNIGYCGQTDNLKISKIMLHHWEEPFVSGTEQDKGSGAIFFTGCNLKCVYCQNEPISHGGIGKDYSLAEFIEEIKKLEESGALNINLVTPTHWAKQIVEAFKIYRPKIPVVWNSSGYETVEMLELINDYVDIFLVDLKYMNNELAMRYSKAPNYAEIAQKCILKMRSIQPKDIFENGIMKKGVVVRHLVLPSNTNDSIKCLNFVAENLGNQTFVSIMSQFEPRYNANMFEEINRKITPLEYKRVVNHALKLGLTNALVQDLSSADSKYTPDFNE